VGLNVSNEQPSTCINALLREAQQQHSPELNGSPAVSTEVSRRPVVSVLCRMLLGLHALPCGDTAGFP
jgi:hypothetical protein